MTAGVAGLPVTLNLTFFNESTGLPADPASVQLDITYGQEVGFAADFAGPFFYLGASVPTAGQIWRTGVGTFSFIWNIPASAPGGVYIANWTCVFSGATVVGFENFPVAGGILASAAPGDTGYWTGSIDYEPPAGSFSAYTGSTVPLGSVDANGIAWLLNSVTGWDGPDVQGAGVIPKAGDHGAWATPQFYAARMLTLTVTAMAPSQALRDTARAVLQEAIPVGDLALFTYNEPVPKQALVRRSGKITETYPDLDAVMFTCGLVAPDPRKYSTQVQVLQVNALNSSLIGLTVPFTVPFTLPAQPPAGAVAAVNNGNFETRPVITVTGPIAAPTLQNVNTGQIVSWSSLSLAATDVLTADFNVMEAFLNGAYRPADVFSSWWTMPPGQTTIQLGGVAGAGAGMSVSFQDAYI